MVQPLLLCVRCVLQFLEHELKQSYTTKNFTLKSGLLELEKTYRWGSSSSSSRGSKDSLVTALVHKRVSEGACLQSAVSAVTCQTQSSL
jgi:hypothetical protein